MKIDTIKVSKRLSFMERDAFRIDYRKIDHKCRLCGEPATAVKVVSTPDSIRVAMVCDKDRDAEIERLVEDKGFVDGSGKWGNTLLSPTAIEAGFEVIMKETK